MTLKPDPTFYATPDDAAAAPPEEQTTRIAKVDSRSAKKDLVRLERAIGKLEQREAGLQRFQARRDLRVAHRREAAHLRC